MVRFHSSIYADDESLIRQMSRDSAFHGIPHQTAAAHRMKTECLGSVLDHVKHNLFVSEIRSFWCNALIFEARVAEMQLHWAVLIMFLRGEKLLHTIPVANIENQESLFVSRRQPFYIVLIER